jgi:glycosyltransferase involved in cell wall biosynthesis
VKLVFAYDVMLEQMSLTGKHHHESFRYELWKNGYQAVFPSIVIAARTRLTRSSSAIGTHSSQFQVEGPGVEVLPLQRMSRPWHYYTRRSWGKNVIREALSGASALIARLPSEIGMMAIETAIEMDKPWMIEMVGHPFDSMWHNGSWYGKGYAPWNSMRVRYFCKKAPFAAYVTKDYLQSRFPASGRVLGCSDVEIEPIPYEELYLRLSEIPESAGKLFRIGLIGTLATKYKGLETAFKALSRLNLPVRVELDILGGGNPAPWRALAQKLGVADRVSFAGVLPSGQSVREWLDQLDLYIQPSLTEGLPRSLIEAMSRGVPCIASHVGGIPELLPRNRLLKPGDDERLSELIEGMVRDMQVRREAALVDWGQSQDYRTERLAVRRKDFLAEFRIFAENRLTGEGR